MSIAKNSKLHSTIITMLLLVMLYSCCNDEEGKIPITTTSCEAREYYTIGRELAENLQRQKASENFEKAIELDSGFALAYFGMAMVQTKAEEIFRYLSIAESLAVKASEGEQLLIKAMHAGINRDPEQQLKYYQTLLEKYKKDERVLYQIGNFYFSQRDFEKAIEYYKKTIQMNENFAPVYNQLGYAFRFVEKYEAAEKTFKQYIRLIPNNPNPYDSYAELLLKMGEYESSLEQYGKAIKQDSTFVASYIGMATNLVYISDYYEARLLMDQFYNNAQNEEEKRRALVFSAVSYVDEGDYNKAIEILEKLIDESKENENAASNAVANGIKSAIYFETGKYDQAVTAYKKAIEIIKNSKLPVEIKHETKYDILFGEALVLSKRNKFEQAKLNADNYMKEAQNKNDLNQIRKGYEIYGRIALDMKEYDKAIENLLQADLHNPYNLYLLAQAYKKNNDIENAKLYLKKVVNFNSLLDLNYAFCRLKAKYELADLQ